MNKIKINEKNIIIWLAGIALSLSASATAFYNIVYLHYTTGNIILTILTSFIVMLCFFMKTIDDSLEYIKKNISLCIFILLLSFIILMKLCFAKEKYLSEFLTFNFSIVIISAFSSFSLTYISIWLYRRATEFLKEIFSQLDIRDKKLYLYISIAAAGLIVAAHTSSTGWYTGCDKIYSIDPGLCFYDLFINPLGSEQGIRHPIIFSFTFPFCAIVESIADIFVPENINIVFKSITLQIINSQLLLLGGLIIKILTKSKTTFILYVISFSTMLYLIIFEKHQLCIFPLILYVYMIIKHPKKSTASLIAASGLSPTNFFAVFMELFTKGTAKEKFLKLFKTGVYGILTVICLGNGHLLTDGISELIYMKEKWASAPLSIVEKFIAATKMYHGSLFELSSIKQSSYTWSSPVTKNITVLSMFILMLVIIGIINSRNQLFTKLCAVWVIFSFFFFMVLGWSPEISPIFNIYFAWAIIPMFKNGVDCVFIESLNINKKIVYGFLLSLLFLTNILSVIDIGLYLKTVQ